VPTEAEKQLATLVAMPTISDDIIANDMAMDYIQAYVAERGVYCKRYRFKGHSALLASTQPNNLLTPKVLLSGHTDVVTGDEGLFTLTAKGDKLFGRGVYDMKFALAGYLQIIDELKDNLSSYDLGLMITSDEEISSVSVHELVKKGLKPQVCIMPDSTAPGWDIETVAKGFWRFDLIAEGRTAHGARPWEGESASLKTCPARTKGAF
jgi:succinyl-diaminopimelate desuccinylase